MNFPASYEFPNAPYFSEYLVQVDANLFDVYESQTEKLLTIFKKRNEHDSNFAYATGKWSMKQVLGHMVDTERIFFYRALSISRGEKQNLLGFDENDYMLAAGYENQSLEQVISQYTTTRNASIACLQSLDNAQWNRMGIVNGYSISVRALAWMIAGHEKHHLQILEDRYLTQIS
jgi:hypothetical protein